MVLHSMFAIVLAVQITFAFSSSVSVSDSAERAAPPSSHIHPLHLTQTIQSGLGESEIDDLVLADIDPNMPATEVLRLRPFVLHFPGNTAFSLAESSSSVWSAEAALADLEQFLIDRELAPDARLAALQEFDRPEVVTAIPAPSLRAALLYFWEWEPFDAAIRSILGGENSTGLPFAAIEFADLGYENAVATIFRDPHLESSQFRLQVDDAFDGEPPAQLAPVILHEAMHGDGINSVEEELTANIVDTIAYAHILLFDPAKAHNASDLTFFNNSQVYALLNSSGRRGGSYVGLATSPAGDVFVGFGLEDIDADSIRAAIIQDDFYSSLGHAGATFSPAADHIVRGLITQSRFELHDNYDESLLAALDWTVGSLISPSNAVDLAILLGLQITVGVGEGLAGQAGQEPVTTGSRPLIPNMIELFSLNHMHRSQTERSELKSEQLLREALHRRGAETVVVEQAISLFNSSDAIASLPDPQLRAAVALLSVDPTWSRVADRVVGREPFQTSVFVDFAHFAEPITAVFQPVAESGLGSVTINSMLSGDSLEVLAAAVVEGALLESTIKSEDLTLAAAVLSTIAYADLAIGNPDIVANQTWGTIRRNQDVMALLNSGQSVVGRSSDNLSTFGFLAAAGSTVDILPGLIQDATSFEDYVVSSPRNAGTESTRLAVAAPLYVQLAGATTLGTRPGTSQPVISPETISDLDATLYEFIGEDDFAVLASVMNLVPIAE